jgi:hypothetical protein
MLPGTRNPLVSDAVTCWTQAVAPCAAHAGAL